MKVQILFLGSLSEGPAVPVSGELTSDADRISLTWEQSPETGETAGTLYRLRYLKASRVLHLSRKGEYAMHLSFMAGTGTQGVLSTPHGDIRMDIDTKSITVPDCFPFSEAEESGSRIPAGTKCIRLHYSLQISGQEPTENDMSIQISLEKNQE